jgi:hypothetical protein
MKRVRAREWDGRRRGYDKTKGKTGASEKEKGHGIKVYEQANMHATVARHKGKGTYPSGEV